VLSQIGTTHVGAHIIQSLPLLARTTIVSGIATTGRT
jgi:hypothetical protein